VKVSVRPATPADAGLLAQLGEQTFRETFQALYEPADFEAFVAETYGEQLQRAELADVGRPALVLEVGGTPAGFAQLRLDHREPCVPGARPAELQRIYLLKAWQGGGRGAALMAAAERLARAQGADVLWLGVWERNVAALGFYAHTGFREVGEHGFRIGSRVDRDVVLAKVL
jgi:GNAT superfamily N-acetyltransferase